MKFDGETTQSCRAQVNSTEVILTVIFSPILGGPQGRQKYGKKVPKSFFSAQELKLSSEEMMY